MGALVEARKIIGRASPGELARIGWVAGESLQRMADAVAEDVDGLSGASKVIRLLSDAARQADETAVRILRPALIAFIKGEGDYHPLNADIVGETQRMEKPCH